MHLHMAASPEVSKSSAGEAPGCSVCAASPRRWSSVCILGWLGLAVVLALSRSSKACACMQLTKNSTRAPARQSGSLSLTVTHCSDERRSRKLETSRSGGSEVDERPDMDVTRRGHARGRPCGCHEPHGARLLAIARQSGARKFAARARADATSCDAFVRVCTGHLRAAVLSERRPAWRLDSDRQCRAAWWHPRWRCPRDHRRVLYGYAGSRCVHTSRSRPTY